MPSAGAATNFAKLDRFVNFVFILNKVCVAALNCRSGNIVDGLDLVEDSEATKDLDLDSAGLSPITFVPVISVLFSLLSLPTFSGEVSLNLELKTPLEIASEVKVLLSKLLRFFSLDLIPAMDNSVFETPEVFTD